MTKTAIALSGVLGFCLFAGCDPSRKAAATSTPGPELSPAQIALRLQTLYRDRKYSEISELICVEERGPMIDLLVAVDRVLSSNSRLRAAAERRYGGPMSETWSIGEISNNLGPFSEALAVIDQEIGAGGKTIVVLQEGKNVPLFRAEFVQVDSRWVYVPEKVSRVMVAEVQRLSEILGDIASGVETGAAFDYYLGAFVQDVYPQMQKIMTVRDPAMPIDSPAVDGQAVAAGEENSPP